VRCVAVIAVTADTVIGRQRCYSLLQSAIRTRQSHPGMCYLNEKNTDMLRKKL